MYKIKCLQKTQWVHVFTSSRSGARELLRLAIFEIMHWKMGKMFTLGLNAAKSTDYIKKCFKQKLSKIKFCTQNSVKSDLLSPQRVEIGCSKCLPFLKYALEWKSRFNCEQNTTKNTDYIEKYSEQKLYKIKFLTKTRWTHVFIPPQEWS